MQIYVAFPRRITKQHDIAAYGIDVHSIDGDN